MFGFKSSFILFCVAFCFNVLHTSAQCESFIPEACKLSLGKYVHDGINNSVQLSEGESAELFKTFYSGQTYRMVVCKANNLPPIHVKVIDNKGRVLFDNKSYNYEQIWDFTVLSTQMLVIQMKVTKTEVTPSAQNKGCVSVLFGVDNN